MKALKREGQWAGWRDWQNSPVFVHYPERQAMGFSMALSKGILEDVRKHRGLTLDEAAKEVGVSRQTWYRWETTRQMPIMKHIGPIVRWLLEEGEKDMGTAEDVYEQLGAVKSECRRLRQENARLQWELDELKVEMRRLPDLIEHKRPTFVWERWEDPGEPECGAGRALPPKEYLVVERSGLYSIDLSDLDEMIGLTEEEMAACEKHIYVKGDEVWIELC